MYKTLSYIMFYGKEQATFYIVIMYAVMVILAVELARCILKLLYEKKKLEISRKEIPVLLADKDTFGEDTVYKRTISTLLPRILKDDDKFTERLDRKYSNTSFGELHSISAPKFVASTLKRTDKTQSVPDTDTSKNSRLKITISSRNKPTRGRSINKSKKNANTEGNVKLKLKLPIPLEHTQTENDI
uniref:Bm9796 n=2 Tax=Brugia TaxID=6278 RepID=A0A0J9XTQ1_BRUMA|nr:Bm9796 [Brugia malayi]